MTPTIRFTAPTAAATISAEAITITAANQNDQSLRPTPARLRSRALALGTT